MYSTAFWHSYGLETVVLRYFNVFGPRQDPSGPYAAVIPLFIQAILGGKQPVIFGDGKQTRDFTFVDNIVQANLLAASAGGAAGQVVNVGSGVAVSLLELLKELKAILGSNIEPILQPARAGDVRDSLADISRAKTILGYQPVVGLSEGLRRTVEFYRGA
jgi:UDP-glucose 4-epimerase